MYLSDAWRPRIGSSNHDRRQWRWRPGGGGGFGGGGFGGGGAVAVAAADSVAAPARNGGGNLQLNYGVRLEHTSYTGAPAENERRVQRVRRRTRSVLPTRDLPLAARRASATRSRHRNSRARRSAALRRRC